VIRKSSLGRRTAAVVLATRSLELKPRIRTFSPFTQHTSSSIFLRRSYSSSTHRVSASSSSSSATTCHIPPVLNSPPAGFHFTFLPRIRPRNSNLMPPKVALLSFSNHIWMQTTVNYLSQHGVEIDVLIEEDSETASVRSRMWKDVMYEKSTKPIVSQKLKKIEESPYKSMVNKSFLVESINKEAPDILKVHAPDVIILANCGIIHPEVIKSAPICLNAHPALLKGTDGIRGALPFLRAILLNRPLGVSVHHVVPEVDRGEIISRKRIAVQYDDGVGDIMFRILEKQADMLVGLLKMEKLPTIGKVNECKSKPFRWNDGLFDKAHAALRDEKYSHWYSGVKGEY